MKQKLSKNVKIAARVRRAYKIKKKISELGVPKMVVFRSCNHIYAQIVSDGKIIVSASSLEKNFRKEGNEASGNVKASMKVGQLVGQRAQDKGIKKVAFDRNGYRYHGRVKALAEAARETGLVI